LPLGPVVLTYGRGALLQSLNSYSYANDNPITKSDPTGKCIYDGCVVEGVAVLGFASGVTAQAFNDASTGLAAKKCIRRNTIVKRGSELLLVRD
jgi:hypothetical protein